MRYSSNIALIDAFRPIARRWHRRPVRRSYSLTSGTSIRAAHGLAGVTHPIAPTLREVRHQRGGAGVSRSSPPRRQRPAPIPPGGGSRLVRRQFARGACCVTCRHPRTLTQVSPANPVPNPGVGGAPLGVCAASTFWHSSILNAICAAEVSSGCQAPGCSTGLSAVFT